jgi:phosphinothricin acetyltransferase
MIRDATEADLPAIVDIYNSAIPGRWATADTDPVSVESRRAWLLERDYCRYPVWVFEAAAGVMGWLSFNPFYGRPAYAATAEVSLYVDPRVHRRGVATSLLRHAFERGASLKLNTLLSFVFAHNEKCVALCTKFGFEPWGNLPRVALLDGIERDLLILGYRLSAGGGAPRER